MKWDRARCPTCRASVIVASRSMATSREIYVDADPHVDGPIHLAENQLFRSYDPVAEVCDPDRIRRLLEADENTQFYIEHVCLVSRTPLGRSGDGEDAEADGGAAPSQTSSDGADSHDVGRVSSERSPHRQEERRVGSWGQPHQPALTGASW